VGVTRTSSISTSNDSIRRDLLITRTSFYDHEMRVLREYESARVRTDADVDADVDDILL